MQPHRLKLAADNRYIIQTIAYSSEYSCPIPSWAPEAAQTESSDVAKLQRLCAGNDGDVHHSVHFEPSLARGKTAAQILFFISLAVSLSLHASTSYSQASLDTGLSTAIALDTDRIGTAASTLLPAPEVEGDPVVQGDTVVRGDSSYLERVDSSAAATLSYGVQQTLSNAIAEPQEANASYSKGPANKTPYGLAKLVEIQHSTEQFSLPVTGFAVTSFFGNRIHPIFGNRRFHKGIDLGAPTGTPVRAARGGQVISAGWGKGYGNRIIINHGDGYETLYAHLDRLLVKVGDRVTNKAVIGLSGSTGYVTGPHLHFEIRYQQVARNPLGYFKGYLKP